MSRLNKRNIIIFVPLLGILFILFLLIVARPNFISLPAEPTLTPTATAKASTTPKQEINEALPTASPVAEQQGVIPTVEQTPTATTPPSTMDRPSATATIEPTSSTTMTPTASPTPLPPPPNFGDCLTPEEVDLIERINQYRNANGLADIPISKSLTQVAQWHVVDLHENAPDSGSDHELACNMHSWSGKGAWDSVCYTADHVNAAGMWNKPREITSNRYTGNGYENAYETSEQARAEEALDSWKNSAAHNDVILEQGIWSDAHWPAMGVGIYQHHAVVWFGDETDPQGTVTDLCNVYDARPIR